MTKILLALTVTAAAISAGCNTSRAARDSASASFITIRQINEQQILDNAAMFAHSEDAVPSFAMITTGQVSVSDNVSASLALTGLFRTGNATALTPSATRAWNHTWNTQPISSFGELSALRTVFQSLRNGKRVKIEKLLKDLKEGYEQAEGEISVDTNDAAPTKERKLLAKSRLNSAITECSRLERVLESGILGWATTKSSEAKDRYMYGSFGGKKVYVAGGKYGKFSEFSLFTMRLLAVVTANGIIINEDDGDDDKTKLLPPTAPQPFLVPTLPPVGP